MPRDNRLAAWRAGGVIAGVLTVSVLHYHTSPAYVLWHELFRHLYYLPIVGAAYWFGATGGLATAAGVAIVYFPHIQAIWSAGGASAGHQYADLIVFALVALVVGLLSTRQHALTEQYRRTAVSLEQANRELRESHAHLRRADRLRVVAEIATGLAHEIRNPLAGIQGAMEIVGARVRAGTPESEFSTIALKEVQRLEGLVANFLTFARPRDPEFQAADVGEIVDRVAVLLRPDAERTGVLIDRRIDPGLVPALIDPEQIAQLLVNLVRNAIEASPAGGRVRISAAPDGSAVRVDVTDEGSGIDREHLDHIFDPFFTTKPNGTGLGLAISQRIAAAHHGGLDAEPGPGGRGTVFRLRLPTARGQDATVEHA